MKEEILKLMKEQLRAVIENITYDNYMEMESQVFRVFTIIETAETMMDTPRPIHPLLEANEEETQVLTPLIKQILENCPEPEMTMEQFLAEEEKEKQLEREENGRTAHRFERKIKGGVIPDIGAYVPEMIIRDLELRHGDMLYSKFLSKPENGPAKYEYEIAERNPMDESPENIIEIKMGVISYQPRFGSLAIDKTINEGDLSYEGERLTLKVAEEDLNNRSLDLREGDIVNAAFYANNPEYMRVRWKYNMDELEEDFPSTPKPSGYYKKKEDGDKKEYEQIFTGNTIVCMGYEPGWSDFREEVERRGGEFIGITGRESRDSLAGTLRKADCLIMTIGHVGHGGTQWAVPFCKVNGVPYGEIKTFGRTTFVEKAKTLLKK